MVFILISITYTQCEVLVTQSYLTLCKPMECGLPRPSVHGDSPGKNTGVGCHALLQGFPGIFPGDLPNPRIKPRSPALQADSLLAEPPGKPKNTRVGSLSLLQKIFPTQESNQGLLHCRWILYQLSYERHPHSFPHSLGNLWKNPIISLLNYSLFSA